MKNPAARLGASLAPPRSLAFVVSLSRHPLCTARRFHAARAQRFVGHASACPGERSSPLAGFHGARQISPASRWRMFGHEGVYRSGLADATNGQTPEASFARLGKLKHAPRLRALCGTCFRGTCKIPQTACLRARLIIPELKQQFLLSRDREGAVLLSKQP